MKVRAVGLILIVMLLGAVGAQGQDRYAPVFETDRSMANISWSFDSSNISFQLLLSSLFGIVDYEYNSWHQYHISTGRTTISSLWPQPYVITQGLERGRFPAPPVSSGSYTFTSPDGRYLVYLTEGLRIPCYFIAIADLTQNSGYAIEDAETCNARSDFNDLFDVRWSDDGTALTIRTDGVNQHRYYISNFARDVSQATSFSMINFDINGENIEITTALDLNQDGSIVILNYRQRLYLWHPDAPENSEIIARSEEYGFIAAAFSPDNQRIWYIDRDGLHQYDLATEDTRLLTAAVNATWVDDAYFSPDGQYVALVRREGPSRQEVSLYVEAMAQWLGEEDA